MQLTTTTRFQRFLQVCLIAGLFLAAWPQLARAQAPTPEVSDDAVNAIAKQMFCPICENTPLDVCPTQACHQWRETIRTMLAEGNTEQEIKDYFVAQYGDRVLAEPPRTGFNWLVYVIPPLALLGGAIVLVRVLRSWQAPAGQEAVRPPTVENDDYVRRLEEELKRRG